MNIDKINNLCQSYIIALDPERNSLRGNVPVINNGRIFVSMPNNSHRFNFKIVWHKPGIAQIQCLSSFKLLTINKNNEVYFEEYFKLADLNISLFYVIYDEIAVCLFPVRDPNLILIYAEGLYFKSLETPFETEEQTIFEYDLIDYSCIHVITNQPMLDLSGVQMIRVDNIRECLLNIITNYYNLPEKILICLGKLMFPIDFYIENESWCLVDRKFSMPSMRTYKRKLDINNLADLEFISENEADWVEIKSIADEIPPLHNTQMVWDKLISSQISNTIYYSSLNTYIITRSQIQSKNANYYNKIIGLLEKSKDPKVHKLIEYALMTIFFSA